MYLKSESSPELIPPLDFKMGDTTFRKKFLERLLNKKHTQVDTYLSIPIYMTGGTTKGYLFSTNGSDLFYFVKFDSLKLRGLDTKATVQLSVWRNDEVPYTSDLSQYLFDGILSSRFDIMASDGQQTPKGKRFWVLRMTKALQQNKYVYMYDRMTHELSPILTLEDMTSAIRSSYGSGRSYRDKRFLISGTRLGGRD